ncbi:hypothetical protein INT48_001314 [Thamnidium elegans]|uniref:Uncharacterized protein n=1 Tax=Thamnidium elegans TaxID=101142 RepID=A0A8H7VTK8_9FUNG|nr:hypothetical protein INT48_001314 [Thamnidium elegans]
MPGRFVNYVVFPVTTAALLAEGSTRQGYKTWKKINDGLGVNDVGRSCGGV